MFCKECGSEAKENDKFCKECGTQIEEVQEIQKIKEKSIEAPEINVENYMDNKIKSTTKFSSVQDFISNGKPIINKIHWVSVAIAILFALIGYLADLIVFTYLALPFALFWIAIEVFSSIQYYGYYKRKKYHISKPVDYNRLSEFINETIGKYEGFTVGAYGVSRVKKHHVVQFRLHGTLINIDFGRKEDSTQYTLYIDGNPYNHCSHCARAAIVHPIITSAVEYYDNKDNPQKLENNVKFFKPEKSKNIVPLIGTVIICAVVIVGTIILMDYVNSKNSNVIIDEASAHYINIVRHGTLNGATPDTVTLGTALATYFNEPKWDYFYSTEGSNVVEFSSNDSYYGKVRIQFLVDFENETFEIGASVIDSEKQEDLMTYSLISNALESVGVEWNPLTAGLDEIDPFEVSVELWKSWGYSDDEIEAMLARYNEDGSLDQDKYADYVSSMISESFADISENAFEAVMDSDTITNPTVSSDNLIASTPSVSTEVLFEEIALNTVKNGTFVEYPDKPIAETIEKYFNNVEYMYILEDSEWITFYDDDGNLIVRNTVTYISYRVMDEIVFEFLYSDDGTFTLYSVQSGEYIYDKNAYINEIFSDLNIDILGKWYKDWDWSERDEYSDMITFYDNNTFDFRINIDIGMVNVTGTYEVDIYGNIECHDSNNYYFYDYFTFYIRDDGLEYIGEQFVNIVTGDKFIR